MKTTGMFLLALASLLFCGNAAAWAQRGQGRGAAGHPAGGPPSIGSLPQGGPGQSGTHGGRDTSRPETGQQRNERSADSPASHTEDHATGRPETRPDSGQRSPAEHLAQSPKLSSKLQGFFPAGTNLTQQAQGFKNLGDFVSAAHVSRNLNIPFAEIKTRMTNGQNLGEAIHELKPDADHRAEERKAREQARKDLQETESRS